MTNESIKRSPRLDDRLEAEIEDALGGMSLDDIMAMDERPAIGRAPGSARAGEDGRAPQSGRQRKIGTIISIRNKDVFVEFGPKSQGVCSLTAFPDPEKPPKPGDRMEFIVERFDAENELLILSREGSITKADWESLEIGQVVEARCTGVNKGGLEMEIAHHRAFMPAGQVDIRHIPDLSIFVGEKFPCEVIEVSKDPRGKGGRIILSRRGPLEAARIKQRESILETLQPGNQMRATITSVQPYGAFADIGGMDGLIHISDMSYTRIKHPSEIVKVGDVVTVQVLKIDREVEPPKIGLGLKQTSTDPAIATLGSLKEGETVTGRVTRLAAFGAFVELGPGVEGLIHISELSDRRVNDVRSVVKENEVVTVKILSIDAAAKRISLSLRATQARREEENLDRGEDAHMRKLKAQLNARFGSNLRGGIG